LKLAHNPPVKLEKDPATGRFLPGNSGFGGRPRGSRNKLTTEFLDALYADFQANGAEAVARCRKEKPAEYVRIVASILPKDLELTVNSQVEVTGILEAAATFSEAYAIARSVLIDGAVEAEVVQDD
jgi:hypothetical protein